MAKRSIKKHKVFDNVTMDADVYSESTDCEGVDFVKYHMKWSGGASPVGFFKLQISDDGKEVNDNLSTWITPGVDVGEGVEINGDDGECLIHVNVVNFKKSRIFYDFTSGNATLDGWIKANTRGA